MPNPNYPKISPLNIQNQVTRIKGQLSPLTDRVTLVSDSLDAIQSWANVISAQIIKLLGVITSVSSTGTVSFVDTNMVVVVNQSTNQLIFKVQYVDGTIKTGVIPLA